jgi:hypothetical protein
MIDYGRISTIVHAERSNFAGGHCFHLRDLMVSQDAKFSPADTRSSSQGSDSLKRYGLSPSECVAAGPTATDGHHNLDFAA